MAELSPLLAVDDDAGSNSDIDEEGCQHTEPEYDSDADMALQMPPKLEYRRRQQSAEKRIPSLESLAVVSALLSGFALTEAIEFRPSRPEWSSPRKEVYISLLLFGMAVNMYLSAVGILTAIACKRVASWDWELRQKTPSEVFHDSDYQVAMRVLFGDEEDKWVTSKPDVEAKMLNVPLTYFVLKNSIEGSCSPLGLAIELFPYSIVAYLVAFGMDLTREATAFLHVVIFTPLVAVSVCQFWAISRMLRLIRS